MPKSESIFFFKKKIHSKVRWAVFFRLLHCRGYGFLWHLHELFHPCQGKIFQSLKSNKIINFSQDFSLLSAESFMPFLGCIMQCFIFCHCGQMVLNASEECCHAIYDSFWYQLKRIDQRRIVVLMLIQSQKDVGFTAEGFPVSLQLYMMVSANLCLFQT